MANERVKARVVASERVVVGGMAVEITRHGGGFRVYGVIVRGKPGAQKVQLRRLPMRVEGRILEMYGSPHGGAGAECPTATTGPENT